MENISVGLIKGRHTMPVDAYIFEDAIADVHDYRAICRHIFQFISENVGINVTDFGHCINQASDDDTRCFVGGKSLTVYVTGLTCVTASLIQCCAMYGVKLTLMHFDSSTGEYKSQYIF